MSRLLYTALASIQPHYGQKVQIRLANGPTYQELMFESNVPPERVEKISINIGGVHSLGDIIEVTGEDAKMLEAYKGRSTGAVGGVHTYIIPLGNREGRTELGQFYTGLVTLPTDTINVSIQLAKSTSQVQPWFKGHATVTAAQPTRTMVPIIKSQTVINNVDGEFDFQNLQRDLAYKRLHLKGDIKRVVLNRDGSDSWDLTDSVNKVMLKREDMKPQNGFYHLDFVQRGFIAMDLYKAQLTSSELNLKITMGTPENVRLLVEAVRFLPEPVAA